jgi:hypothetical protein
MVSPSTAYIIVSRPHKRPRARARARSLSLLSLSPDSPDLPPLSNLPLSFLGGRLPAARVRQCVPAYGHNVRIFGQGHGHGHVYVGGSFG